MKLLLHLRWFFRRYWYAYSLALTMLIAVAAINMIIPWTIGQSIDHILETGDLVKTKHYLIGLLAGAFAVYLLRYGWRRMLFGTSYRLGNILRRQFYLRLTRQGQFFYNTHSTGDLMARATNDIDAVEVAAGEGILSGFDGLITFIAVVVMMFCFIDWRLAAVAVLPFPLMGIGFYRLSTQVHHQFRDSLNKFSALNEQTQQAIIGIRMIKAMGREKIETNKFEKIAEQAAGSTYLVQRSEAKFHPIVQLSLGAAMLIVLLAGGWRIHENQLTIGQLTSFTMYLSELIWPMYAFGWLLNILQRGSAAIERLEELLTLPDSIPDCGKSAPTGYEITVSNLTFSYPDSSLPSLKDINFTLKENRVLGITGATGAGKSTLLQLLMRYWETPPDTIRLADSLLQDIPLKHLRANYAYVPQDAFLFSATIRENIQMGYPEANDEEIVEAARLAAIHKELEHFPDGYNTMVGEKGVTLSGGQRQRIAIARALIRQSPVLILDDALSAVDIQTEKIIIQHLRKRPRQTLILVSHRLSAIEHADEILVLSQGKIIERGTHQQLVADDGWYSRMAAYQQMEQAMEDAP
ncbi:ABC transporter ATP-binding protein [Desulfogranum japonicum]|uniref:ABC transporter ATP-binding protein n=1 Tax=Desulfogranum japonicum TaxID=231447 RepID=UPI00048E1DC8|nr:ABC transporter transmembrane domain-containing protein [Desulfogranum japonicum]